MTKAAAKAVKYKSFFISFLLVDPIYISWVLESINAWALQILDKILTVEALLAGKRINYPPSYQVNVKYKKAPKAGIIMEPQNLPYGEEE